MPDTEPTPPLPTTPAEAQAEIERTYADGTHAYHTGDAAAVDRMLALHRVVYTPTPANTPPAPQTLEQRTARRQARIEAIQANPAFRQGDMRVAQELGGLLMGEDAPEPTAPEAERPPRELTTADLPRFSLPPDTPADDPDVRAVAEITAHAGLEPNTVQEAINRVLRLAQDPVPEDPAELDALVEQEGARAIQAARDRFGRHYDTMREHVGMAKAILRAEAPAVFALLHSHPSMLNDLTLFEALATLGARSREFHVSKYGTSRAPHV
jgi:hypothetical protein